MASPDALKVAITAIHQAIADHPDPQSKATLSTCLQNMLKVQANDYQQAQGAEGPRQPLVQRVGGQAGPPQMGGGY